MLWSVKTSYRAGGSFTITNGQNGPGTGLVVPTVFLSPDLSGIVYVHPVLHTSVSREVVFGKGETKLSKKVIELHAQSDPFCVVPFSMPVNPGSSVRDPGLEAVRLLLDGPQFPRLRQMFQDAKARSDNSVVSQLHELGALLKAGQITEAEYRGAVSAVTGISSKK